jgi:4a-hydroxytetrahydrobiopterin dehydratase
MGKVYLTSKKCVACEGGVPPLTKKEIVPLLGQIPAWSMSPDGKTISSDFKFNDFVMSMKFVNDVAALAESEGHHPDIYISYNKVHLDLTTHAIGGLSENDFIVAAKVDQMGTV